MTTTRIVTRVRAGLYLSTDGTVEIAHIPDRRIWITRQAGDPRVTYDAYLTLSAALADLAQRDTP